MSVSRDATSLKFVPATAAEWTDFVNGLGIGALHNLHGLQDVASPVADAVGTAPLAGSATAFASAITGWTRKGAFQGDTGGASIANLTDTNLPDLNATSMTYVGLLFVTTITPTTLPGGLFMMGPGGTEINNVVAELHSGGEWQLTDGTNTAVGSVNHGTGMVPFVLRYNQTAGTVDLFVGGFSGSPEKISKTFVRPPAASRGIWLCAAYHNSSGTTWSFLATLSGASAEISDAQAIAAIARFTTGNPVSITVTPSTPSILVGGAVQLTATATFADGSTADVTASSSWVSSIPGDATVSATGLVTGLAPGAPVITATFGTLTSTSSVTVTATTVTTVVPLPNSVLTLLRFDESLAAVPPKDALGSLNDLGIDTGLSLPPVTIALCGFARAFSNGFALDAVDAEPGATLTTRDVTIQAILSWDLNSQNTLATDGTIIARGKGNAPAEYVAYGLQLHVVNAALQIGRMIMWWQDTAGTVHTQQGGDFVLPPVGGFMMLTATRRWIDSTHVEVRYYAGDQLLADALSSNGDIGGGTTGTFCVGTRYSAGAPGLFLCGVIDELRVANYEMSHEEIAATWTRISKLQPRAVTAMKQLMQPGAPISHDPASSVQKLFVRAPGMALGYAAGQIENFRQNTLPDRAFGPTLAEWEQIVGQAPLATFTTDQRRARVIAHLAQKAGVSIPGVAATVNDLLQLGPGQLQVLAFDSTIRDSFTALNTQRWAPNPSSQWSIGGSGLRVQLPIGSAVPFDGPNQLWQTCFTEALGSRYPKGAVAGNPAFFDGHATKIIASIIPTTLPTSCEVGVAFFDWCAGNGVLFGLRNNAGTFQLIVERFVGFVSQGVSVEATVTLVHMWLFLQQLEGATATTPATYQAAWSTTAQLGPYVSFPTFINPAPFQRVGFYARTFGGASLATALDMSFNDLIVRNPHGPRPFWWYAFRDSTLPGAPDLAGAESALKRLEQAQAGGHVITLTSAIADTDRVADTVPAGVI